MGIFVASYCGIKEGFTGVTTESGCSQDAALPTSHFSDSNLVKVANDFHSATSIGCFLALAFIRSFTGNHINKPNEN